MFKLEVRMCCRLLELFPSLFFQWCWTKFGFQIPLFQTIQKVKCACRINTETQLTVLGAQEGGDKRFAGVELGSLLLWLLMFSVWKLRVLSPV